VSRDEFVRALARPGPLVVLVLGAAYGVTVRRDVGRLVTDQGGVLDGWAVLLSCLADPYSTLALLLPVAAVQACGHVTHRYDHAALVRRGSWARWLAATTRSALAPTAALLLAWLAAGLLATTGLPWPGDGRPGGWQVSATRDLGTAQLLPHLAGSGLTPPVLLVAQLLLLLAAMLAGHTLLGAVASPAERPGTRGCWWPEPPWPESSVSSSASACPACCRGGPTRPSRCCSPPH